MLHGGVERQGNGDVPAFHVRNVCAFFGGAAGAEEGACLSHRSISKAHLLGEL